MRGTDGAAPPVHRKAGTRLATLVRHLPRFRSRDRLE